MDGNLGPWSSVGPTAFSAGATPATLRLAWDESALRMLCEVGDAINATDGVPFLRCYRGLWLELCRV